MISILIPVYNYNVTDLLLKIHSQILKTGVPFEIICLDDCSNNKHKIVDSNSIYSLNGIQIHRNKNNIGRTETRQKLAEMASFEWLLFLDADVSPSTNSFLENYLNQIANYKFDVCFGGFAYDSKQPCKEKILRWKYGKKKEVVSAEIRNKTPYKIIISANLLIKKKVFININNNLKGNYYGYDNIFSILLKQKDHKVTHINNTVVHLGLESNLAYLTKKEQAAKTIFMLYQKGQIGIGDNDLLKSYELFKKLGLIGLITVLFLKKKKYLKSNILSDNPSILFLNIYRLGYFCNLG